MSHEQKSPGSEDGDAVLRAVGSLPQSIEPQRDLWPGIAEGLDRHRVTRSGRFEIGWSYAVAAAIGCLALGALLSYAVMRREPAATVPTDLIASTSKDPTVQRASFGNYAALGPEYERARAALAIDLAERLDRLPPVTRLRIEQDLAEIQKALAQINAALELTPGDPMLEELLMNTYQGELGLLAQLNQTTGSLPART
jgi:hypothetical protein